jgi:hypothetical protein
VYVRCNQCGSLYENVTGSGLCPHLELYPDSNEPACGFHEVGETPEPVSADTGSPSSPNWDELLSSGLSAAPKKPEEQRKTVAVCSQLSPSGSAEVRIELGSESAIASVDQAIHLSSAMMFSAVFVQAEQFLLEFFMRKFDWPENSCRNLIQQFRQWHRSQPNPFMQPPK